MGSGAPVAAAADGTAMVKVKVLNQQKTENTPYQTVEVVVQLSSSAAA